MKYFKLRDDCLVRIEDIRVILIIHTKTEGKVGVVEGWTVGLSYGPKENIYSDTFPTKEQAQEFFDRLQAGDFTVEVKT